MSATPTVLVVDDDADHAMIVRRTLQRHDRHFEVTNVPDGFTCLEALRRGTYAVVLMDYNLPRMNGLEVLDRVRSEGLTVPVVMVTAQGDERMAVEAMRRGAIDYVVKTSEYFVTLPMVLNKVLKQHELAQDNARLLDEVRTERSRLAQILESTSDGIVLLDDDGRVLVANARAGELLGFVTDKALGIELATLVAQRFGDAHGSERAETQFRALLREVARGGQRDLALPNDHKTLHLTGQPTADGARAALTLTVRDVTREREVDRMKSDFISFATHQLRTPLSGIKWMLELARQEAEVPPGLASYVSDAAAAAERLVRMVNELLDISRLESGRLTTVDQPTRLDEVVRSVLADLKTLIAERRHHVTLVTDERVRSVMVEADLFRHVVANLVSNAAKYTPAGGAIAVRVSDDGSGARLEVQDSGIGIPKAAQPRLFEKFYRADNVHALDTEGTGLGLYLARLIVEHFGGRLRFESEEGRGSTFVVTLPYGG